VATTFARPHAKTASSSLTFQRSVIEASRPTIDRFEQEAERSADRVLAASIPSFGAVQTPIQRLAAGASGSAPASVERVLSSAGQPLAPAVRQDMERRFGHDFSGVRLHADEAATATVAAISRCGSGWSRTPAWRTWRSRPLQP
jgi:uncharacterized protein DUF4157